MLRVLFLVLLAGCAVRAVDMTHDMDYVPTHAGKYTIATWRRITDDVNPIYIYIEGDGHSFDAYGRPTDNPTPRADTVRRMVVADTAPNVAYIARPCQFIMSSACSVHDWTDGRFSSDVIDAMTDAVLEIAGPRPIVLIGYSGGALISGLIISRNADLNVVRWVTVAGVLNHADWTEYFDDSPLGASLNMDELPHVPQVHYVASRDRVVPRELSERWTGGALVVIPDSTHDNISIHENNI